MQILCDIVLGVKGSVQVTGTSSIYTTGTSFILVFIYGAALGAFSFYVSGTLIRHSKFYEEI